VSYKISHVFVLTMSSLCAFDKNWMNDNMVTPSKR